MPTKDGFEFVTASDILYLKAAGNYTVAVKTNNKSIHILQSLKHFETNLGSQGFVRIHHEYLINMTHLIRYNKGDGGEVELIGEVKLPVSKGKKREFMRKLVNLG